MKLNKKQKTITLITIITIVVIIGIVFGINAIRINIANENYNSSNSNSNNSNLLPEYIKAGITLGGVTGTLESLDTSDATALPEDIIWGETAYVDGVKITGTKIITVAHAKEAQRTFEENTVLLDDYGNRVKVPAGFKIAEDSATAVTGGVVIEDVSAEGATDYTKGSQFVWVPVGDVITDNNENITMITLGRYIFNTSTGVETLVQSGENYANQTLLTIVGAEYRFQELLKTTSSINQKAKDIEDFIKHITESRGFYIGRFELGDALATDYARSGTISTSNPENPTACKKNIYPYNYINQADASQLCQEMYNSNYFESDLINSYAWDTTLVFIQSFSGDDNYSISHGIQNTLAKCGEATDGINNDVRCNIYDLAGNISEWSTETSTVATRVCTGRGGNYAMNEIFSSNRGGNQSYTSNVYSGARPIIYL